jgi:solute:Na+ symporter, SSS family
MQSVNLYDYVVIAGYFLFMLGIGIYFKKINKGAREYFAGGNMIPWWVSGMTLYMANFSAWTFTGAAGFAYSTGLFPLLWWGTGGFGYIFGSLLTAKRWRRTRAISPVEYTYTRYNISTQQFLSWIISINFTLSAGVQLASTCKLLAPVMGLDITAVTLVTGTVILLYTFLGGVWAVSVTDVVQGVILLCTTFIVVPLALHLVGGPAKLIDSLPPFSFDHMYNGVHYNEHWLISVFLIGMLGFAGGSGQRFYSVKDEKSALRVGLFAGALSFAGPIIFGVPPLVARIIWPDLSQVDFFKPYIDKNPQDLVYIGICLKFLPNGLIGVFMAAMLAATMSTLSAVYNMVSSIFARDMYQGLFRTRTKDDELLKVGRRTSVVIGLIVIALAVSFVNSQFGVFNLMQAFFTLFNVPVVVPMTFGLIFRKIPKWSAVGGITWGLLAGIAGRYLLGWDIGPQVYLSLAMTLGIFTTSRWTAGLYQTRKPVLIAIAVLITGCAGVLFHNTIVGERTDAVVAGAWAVAAAFGVSLYFFAALFTKETEEERAKVAAFFRKLDTPIDVAKEVFGAGKSQVSIFPLVGVTMIIMGGLLSLVFLTDLSGSDKIVVATLIGMMETFGMLMWYFGKKSEIRASAQN